ncbi:glucose dehydrogenase [FAD, quinone]-like [Centruroides vittatus]|uniref:glucose dehydrogenase [FAD, quinone]-like n=1 Tax=Centruroides vittatus TaxID=120091 RepID=UPI00350FD51C
MYQHTIKLLIQEKIGSGTAGSVIANRISKLPSLKVLVLEAGEMVPLTSQVPLFPLNLALTKYNWNFTSVPSKTIAQGLKNRQHLTVAGKALGGTTVLNYNLFVRGNKRDYDNWAKHGATGWDWDNVFPYFLKVEDNQDYHVIRNVFQPPQGTINKGARWGALQAYINPVRGRRNLWILTSAFVHKILIHNKRAYGVEFEHKGKLYEAYAKHEVIVSAGVFNSPKLLMLSGIGPKRTLEKFDIPIVADLPVGRNFQEQPSTVGMTFGVKTFTYSAERVTVPYYNEFLVNGTGPLTALGAIETIGFVNSKYNDKPDWPDIEILWITLLDASDKGRVLRHVANLNEEYVTYNG